MPKKIGEADADEVELATTKEDWMPTERPMRPSQIEVIEEVEPEPASASDVSDLPKQEPTEGLAGPGPTRMFDVVSPSGFTTSCLHVAKNRSQIYQATGNLEEPYENPIGRH